jgi:ribonuclease-3
VNFASESIERRVGHRFKNPELLKHALTHTSTLNEPRRIRKGGNDLLATVGDAVLDLAVAAILYGNSGPVGPFLTSAKGDLTIERSRLVNNDKLAEFFEKMGLRQYLNLSSGQKGMEVPNSILAQAYEAIVGAIFLDSDYENATDFVRRSLKENRNPNLP